MRFLLLRRTVSRMQIADAHECSLTKSRPRPADPTLDIEKSWLLSAYLHIVILAARSLLTLTRFLSLSSMLCSRISWAKEQMGGGWSWGDSREVFRVVNKSFPMRNKFRRHTNQHLNFPRMKRIRRIISFPFTVHCTVYTVHRAKFYCVSASSPRIRKLFFFFLYRNGFFIALKCALEFLPLNGNTVLVCVLCCVPAMAMCIVHISPH